MCIYITLRDMCTVLYENWVGVSNNEMIFFMNHDWMKINKMNEIILRRMYVRMEHVFKKKEIGYQTKRLMSYQDEFKALPKSTMCGEVG